MICDKFFLKHENMEFQNITLKNSQKIQYHVSKIYYNTVRNIHYFFHFGFKFRYYLIHLSCANQCEKSNCC